MNNTALLALDLQCDFLAEDGRMSIGETAAQEVIASANGLLRRAESMGWSVILVRNEFRKSDWVGNLFRRGAAVEGSAGTEMDPRVMRPSNRVMLTKAAPDAFTNPALVETLQKESIKQIVALGVMAEGCVLETVKSAIAKGYTVTVATDGVGSGRGFTKRSALKKMQNLGATLKSDMEILGALSGSTEIFTRSALRVSR